MDSSIHLPGAWLNEPLTAEEGAHVIDLFTRINNVKPDDNPAEAAQAVMPYMNSLMHLMYLLTLRSRGLKATDDGKAFRPSRLYRFFRRRYVRQAYLTR